jgi:hypothetical protein
MTLARTAIDSLPTGGNTSELSDALPISGLGTVPDHLRWDVDGDTKVTATDVIDVVNLINAEGAGQVRDSAGNQTLLCDIDGDNFVLASDAIQIINYINAGRQLGGEAEAAVSAPSRLSPADTDLMALVAADLAAQTARKRRG